MVALSVAVGTAVTGHGADKGETPAMKRSVLSENGSTRATAYEMSCKVIRSDGTLHVGWLDKVAEIQVRSLDLASGRWADTVHVGTGVDNHSGPAMTMDSQGFLYLIFGPHHGPFQMRRSVRPNRSDAWGPVENVGVNATYPSLVCGPDDTLHLTYRGGAMPRRLLYQRRPAGQPWSAPVELVDAKAPAGYTQYGNALGVGPDGTLHLAFHIYDNHPAGGKAAGYLRSRDGGLTWQTAEGAAVVLPATPDSPCIFARGASLDMRVSNVAVSPDGMPYIGVSRLDLKPCGSELWHHDGNRWVVRDLLPDLQRAFPDRAVGMHGALAFDASGRLYVAWVTGKAPGGGWGHPSWEVALLVSADLGQTFRVMPVSDPDPQNPNWLPSLERPYCEKPIPGPPALIYTQGGPGQGCTEGDGTRVHAVLLDWPPR